MRDIDRAKAATCWLLGGFVCLVGSSLWAADEKPDEDLIKMIAEFVNDQDRDTRALGLQYVRDPKEVPGESATQMFAALLSNLPPDGQAALLEALGDRGDKTALPAILDAIKSKEAVVRAAALRAVGPLGSASEVPLLVEKLATGPDAEKAAAKASLIRLGGDGINAALVAAMAEGKPDAQAKLLGILAARNAKETLPNVLESAAGPELSVRLAALGALRFLADERNTAEIVKLLKAATDDAERRKAELTLLTICSRGREKCADAIIAGLADADVPAPPSPPPLTGGSGGVPARIVLLRCLARAGGQKALDAIIARLKDDDEAVRDQAVRMLSSWPDPGVSSHLLAIAKSEDNLRHQVLAIRGLVRLATPQEGEADFKMLAEAMKLAQRPQEKGLVLGALGGIATPESLALVARALDDPALVNEAGLAAVNIAETMKEMKEADKDELRAVLQKVLKTAKSQQVRQRAEKVLKSL